MSEEIKHIIFKEYENGQKIAPISWCGEEILGGSFMFTDAQHALLCIAKESASVPCLKCLRAIKDLIISFEEGEDDEEEYIEDEDMTAYWNPTARSDSLNEYPEEKSQKRSKGAEKEQPSIKEKFFEFIETSIVSNPPKGCEFVKSDFISKERVRQAIQTKLKLLKHVRDKKIDLMEEIVNQLGVTIAITTLEELLEELGI